LRTRGAIGAAALTSNDERYLDKGSTSRRCDRFADVGVGQSPKKPNKVAAF
jgi:hypothetical protein